MYNELHGAAFCVDPEYVLVDHTLNPDAWKSLKSMVNRMYGTSPEAVRIWTEYKAFKNHKENDEFKHAYIWMAAQSMRANEWWEMFGSHLPALQKLAMRVLTAPVSASAGERNWSAYKHIISDTRTRMTSEHAEQLVYVYWNSRVLSKTMNSLKPKEAFEWDQDSIAWMNETFNWENQGDDEEDVACDEAGNTRVVVTLGD